MALLLGAAHGSKGGSLNGRRRVIRDWVKAMGGAGCQRAQSAALAYRQCEGNEPKGRGAGIKNRITVDWSREQNGNI